MNRLFKEGIVTTVIGLIMLAGATYMYLSKSFTSMEAGELGAMALMFLGSKDSIINIQPKKTDV